MPEIIVYAVEGRTPEQKKSLMRDITDVVVRNFKVPAEAVIVQIVESKKDSKSKGGVPFSERRVDPPGSRLPAGRAPASQKSDFENTTPD